MAEPTSSDVRPVFIELSPQTLVRVALLGALVGVASWLLTALIRQIIFVPLFCGDPANSMCVGATGGAGTIALFVVAVAGLLGLVRLGVYRPLLVVVAAAVSLWGIASWTAEFSWVESLLWTIVLYSLVYTVFTWLVRPRAFAFAAGLTVVVVLLIRLVTAL